MTERIRILDPSGDAPPSDNPLARKLDQLAGKNVGLLFNSKANQGRVLLEALSEKLVAAGAGSVFIVAKESRARPAGAGVIADLQMRADAVVNGVAD